MDEEIGTLASRRIDKLFQNLRPSRLILDDLMLGLRSIEKTGSKLPQGYSFRPEYPLPEAYQKIAEMMGYLK